MALDSVPPGLSQDEVLNAGLVAYILDGNHTLFFPQAYGHEPLYHYWMIPFQLLLGDHWLAARLPSVVLGLLVVALSIRWVRREFGAPTAVVTGLFLAVSWWPIIFSRVALRPIAEPFFLLLGVWFWPTRPWLGGLFWGLSLYTYTGARVVFLIPAAMIIYFMGRRILEKKWSIGNSQWSIVNSFVVLAVSVLVYLPLGITLYLDPTLQQRVDQLAGPLNAVAQGNPWPIIETTLATLGAFGLTGDPRWTYTVQGLPLLGWLTAMFFLFGLAIALWRWRESRYALVLIWLGVGLLPSAVTPQAPSIIRMIGALPVFYLFPAVGLIWLGQNVPLLRQRRQLAVALLLLIIGLNLGRTLYWGFGIWPTATETRDSYQTVLQAIGHYWQNNRPETTAVINNDYYVLLDDDTVRRSLGFAPHPAVRWGQSGQDFTGALIVPRPADQPATLFIPEFAAPAPELLAAAGYPLQPSYRLDDEPSFAVYPQQASVKSPDTVQAVTFENSLTLQGYDLTTTPDRITVLTYWQVQDDTLPEDLKAFLHLLSPAGEVVRQHDGWDAAPAHLQVGDQIVQRHVIPLQDVPADAYALQLGLYRFYTGTRLPHDSADQPPDRLILPDTIAVE